jgi:hypothetical protein
MNLSENSKLISSGEFPNIQILFCYKIEVTQKASNHKKTFLETEKPLRRNLKNILVKFKYI